MELESLANLFAYGSFVCSLSFWLGFTLIHFGVAVGLINILPGAWWLAIQGVGILLAGAAAVSRSKLWRLAVPLAFGDFFFVMYVIGS